MKPCHKCGKCCSLCLGTASENDLYRWSDDEQMIPYVNAGYLTHGVVDLFIDPESGEDLITCPFLVKTNIDHFFGGVEYHCGIYEKRPDVCRDYVCAT